MPTNSVCKSSLTTTGEPVQSALKVADEPMALPVSDPISDWLDRASLGHVRMQTDPQFRAQIARLIAQQLSRTHDLPKP